MVMPLVNGVLGNPPPAPDPATANAVPANDGSNTSDSSNPTAVTEGLAKYVRDAYECSRDFRQTSGVDDTLLLSLRAVRGEYSPDKLSAIKKMGGSEVYLRITANKVRGIAAALRDVYVSSERPWGIDPTSMPETPLDAQKEQLIQTILQTEAQEAMLNGGQVTPQLLYDRRRALRELLYEHTMQEARDAMRARENQMDDILQEGGFYEALWDFLQDIPTFPYAVIKGPVVYYRNKLHWENGKATVKSQPAMTWERCSPFDVYFAPWAQRAQDGYIVHRQRATRASLQALIGLPSYDTDAIKSILDRDPASLQEWWSYTEMDRAELEQRDSDINPISHSTAVDRPFPMLEFHGPVSGELLLEWGMDASKVPDSTQDLDITAWLIDDTIIGVRINPHPLGHKPFYVDSFERVPGSIYGLGVPKMIEDIQESGSATLRALANNMAIASGPQVGVNEGRLQSNEGEISLWPWKVWSFTDDQTGTGKDLPVTFFQPDSNAQELLGVLKALMEMADTFSSLPQYMQGNAQGMSTIGRTSSGLSLLMDAANRTLKQSVTSIDKNVIEPLITDLNIYLSLLRPDIVNDGDINVVAKGATELVQRDQLRMRRTNFLQATANPFDQQIVGPKGRAAILKEVARDLQLPTDEILTGATTPPMGAPQAGPGPGGAMQPPMGRGGPDNAPGPAAQPPALPNPAGAAGGDANPAAGLAAPAKV